MALMKKNLLAAHAACPCDSGKTYADCCGPWHAGLVQGVHAPTPEALMRSRYSAYGLGLIDYLLATWHPSTRPASWSCRRSNGSGWKCDTPRLRAMQGWWSLWRVTGEGGRGGRMHEISRFVRRGRALAVH